MFIRKLPKKIGKLVRQITVPILQVVLGYLSLIPYPDNIVIPNLIADRFRRVMDPDQLNLRQLRIELKRVGLSPSGSKLDLQRRLQRALRGEPDVRQPRPKPSSSSEPKEGSTAGSSSSRRKSAAPKRVFASLPPATQAAIFANTLNELTKDDNEEDASLYGQSLISLLLSLFLSSFLIPPPLWRFNYTSILPITYHTQTPLPAQRMTQMILRLTERATSV